MTEQYHCVITIDEDDITFSHSTPAIEKCQIGHHHCPISRSDLDAIQQLVSKELEESWTDVAPNHFISCTELWIVADPPPSVRYLPTEICALPHIIKACICAYPFLDIAEDHLSLIATLTIMRRLQFDQYHTANYIPAEYLELTSILPEYIKFPWLMAVYIESVSSVPTRRGIYVPDIKWRFLPPIVPAEEFRYILKLFKAMSKVSCGVWQAVTINTCHAVSPLITAGYHQGSICSDFKLSPVLQHLAGFFRYREHETPPVEGCDMMVHHLTTTYQCITCCVRRLIDLMPQ